MKEKKELWIRDFYRAIGYALFLAKQENDTSLRIGYILLDHSIEQFLKSYLRIETRMNPKKFDENTDNFHKLISMAKDKIENSKDALDRILEYHNTRNGLYHSSVYFSISKEKFFEYLDDIFLLCELMKFDNVSDITNEEFNKIIQSVLDEKEEKCWKSINHITNLIKNNFEFPPNTCQDIILVASGYTGGAMIGINLLLSGMLRGDVFIGKPYVYNNKLNGKQVRILEVIEANEPVAYHTFFISSMADSYTWYCFYECLWSNWGKGESGGREIQEIREFTKQNKEKIDYKIDYIRKGEFYDAFNPFITQK